MLKEITITPKYKDNSLKHGKRAKWIIRDQNGKELEYRSMSEAIYTAEQEGWVLINNNI